MRAQDLMNYHDVPNPNPGFTAITLENENGQYRIKIPKTALNISDMFEDLIEPLLVAAGFSQDTIDDYLIRPDI